MRDITVLSGGHGGSKFISGLLHGISTGRIPGIEEDARVTVIANTADDLWMHGVKVCPDLDTVMYTLGNGFDHERGWGRKAETWSIKEELEAYDVPGTWFGLGDRDIATHLVRTQMIEAGYSLSQVTAALSERWLRPVWDDRVRLLPMTDDRVETHVAVKDTDSPSGLSVVHFQEYWVRLRAGVPVEKLIFVGQYESKPGPGVMDALLKSDLVIVPPSNPVVSIGTILGVPGIREGIVATSAPVVGISPIIGGHHVRGMAEQMLAAIGVDATAAGVGLHYGTRGSGGVLDGWLVDSADAAAAVEPLRSSGLRAAAVPLWMSSDDATADIAAAAVELVTR